jgi:hypothetical protein
MDAGNNGVMILADRMLPPRKAGVPIPGPQAHAGSSPSRSTSCGRPGTARETAVKDKTSSAGFAGLLFGSVTHALLPAGSRAARYRA